ncbi:3-keto-disaccharide hydrolase [Chryseolinea lacunae]|uniref:DUF1080 domain-containing protein n=1 Tax=Chryseolinea lacunae TaxID=2801331 RepID=A0ABS1KMB4_9BACT|nr:DUF1080 domain-containing protein [Chryseolinea lacunae]MBL0740387.1 DUF1080 domain-containing protein [Chryseolinea lacunae]
MKTAHASFLLLLLLCVCTAAQDKPAKTGEWISLFDGKTFNGWKANENKGTFTIADGMIVVHGDRAHLFYEGAVMNHNFKNFEFKVSVMTTPGSNSGIFIHTAYQEEGWPSKGYEIQVNQTHTDWRKTGSLYAIQDVKEATAKDNEWYTESVTVQGKKITIKVNDKVINEYTEGENGKLSSGTFALQGHDPKSKVFFKDVMVKPLPD